MADKQLTFLEHLDELRRGVLICLGAIILLGAASMPFSSRLLEILKAPAGGGLGELAFFGPEEALSVYVRIGFFSGFLLSFPVIAYQLWQFVAPAVEPSLRRNWVWFLGSCCLAFAFGCLFAYRILLPAALRFLLAIGGTELVPVISAQRYISFVTGVVGACGLVFQMPVAVFLLARLGVVSQRLLREKFKYALVGIFIAAAIITPTTDIFNMLMLAVPMILLYGVSILIARWARPRGIA